MYSDFSELSSKICLMGNCWEKPHQEENTLGVSSVQSLGIPNLFNTDAKSNSTSTQTLSSAGDSVSSVNNPKGQILPSDSLQCFTYSELKNATRNFRVDSVLGEGGFGCVFKGWVEEHGVMASKPGTGRAVAVKKMNNESFQGHKEWLAEVNYLGQFQHPNLVKLIGYCLEDDQRLLVYEFMSKGSLENHLFRRGYNHMPIPWVTRMKVALGVSRGLAFLHNAERPVIYRDFKTSNILLDSDYNPKLSDFGLAKYGPTGDDTHVSTRVLGTYGYAAPEYVATGMYKNQLQELAQRSCFNLPSYACIREGPDHAPRFKASVNFNGEIFEGPNYCTTLRQAEHAAAEVALNRVSTRGPSRSLAARVLDETGVYKNLLQETAHRAGLNLPVYTTVRSGPGHLPVFTCTVELATMSFTGEPAKTKKQAEKNAAMAAWSALKQLPNLGSFSQTYRESENSEEQEQVVVARALSSLRPKDEINSRSIRQREQQQQARRRMMSNSVAVSSHNNNLQYQQRISLDLLSDVSVYRQQQQQQNCYLALPAPPFSRILHPKSPIFQQSNNSQEPSSSRVPIPSFPVQIRNRSQVQEIPAPLDEHQKDEEEWLNGKFDVTAKPIERDTNSFSRPFSIPDQKTQQTQIRTGYFRTCQPPLKAVPVKTRPAIPPRMLRNCTDFQTLHTMAPAVNIRSVIPVCAAPPMRPPSSNPTTAQMKESSSEGEISGTSSKLSKLQL